MRIDANFGRAEPASTPPGVAASATGAGARDAAALHMKGAPGGHHDDMLHMHAERGVGYLGPAAADRKRPSLRVPPPASAVFLAAGEQPRYDVQQLNKQEGKMNTKNRKFALGAALCAALIAAAAGSSAAADEIKLRMVGAWAPEFSPSADVGHNFMKNVNRLGEGKVRIDYIGAADVVPTFDQPEALVNGVFDVWYGAPNYWAGVVPAGDVTELSPFDTPDNGPGSELYDFMVDLYAEKGVRYVGHAAGLPGIGAHYISAQKKVESLDDLKGMKLRVAPLTRHFAQAAGAEPITLPPSEIYLAMDRGTVDGFTWPIADAFTRYKWQQVSKYLIDQPMYRSGVSVNINQSVWDGLPGDVRQIMLDAMAETQEWTRGWFQKNLDEQIAGMKEAGMEVIEITPEESERWTKLAGQSLWGYYESVMDPEKFAMAEKLLQRGAK